MNQSKIAVRYARALFQLALEKNKLDKIHGDIGMVSQALTDIAQFGLYLKSPVVKPSQKLALIREAFTGHIDDVSLNFLGLLVQNKRESHLEDIFRRFFDVVREHRGIKSARITSAVVLDNQVKQKFHTLLSTIFKADIDLEVHQDASILGGFVLQVGDQQYDASVATGLKRMKTALLTESIK